MDKETMEQIRFVLEDDDDGMRAALEEGSDLDAENKQMNQELIKKHEQILAKLDRGEQLGEEDFRFIREANQIHVNDVANFNGRHQEALALAEWLDQRMELSQDEAMKILEQWLDKDSSTPARVYRALHTLWEEATPDQTVPEVGFDKAGRCLQCGSKVSFADVTDTMVFVGDEVVKRYDGDITNRNCVRCTYPEQYPDYECCDEQDEEGQDIVRDIGTGPKMGRSEVGEMTRIQDYRIVIELCEEEFERSMGGKPCDQGEFDDWARLVEKGLLNGHIDWDILHECARDAMLHGGRGDTRPSCSYSYSNTCKEVDEKMQFDMQSKLDEYLRLLEQVKQKTTDERTAVALLQEVSKDRRSAEIREERETKNSDTNSSQPATEKQKQFMKKLGIKFPGAVTKQEASLMIDEELGKGGE